MAAVIRFRLDRRSRIPTYLQIVQQVRQAIRAGVLRPGDQLPTVKEVVAELVINPNTVLKAYRELDHEGLVEGRPGQGTFVAADVQAPAADQEAIRAALLRWLATARRAGLDEESITALFATTVQALFFKEAA